MIINYNYYHVYNGLNNRDLYIKISKLFRLICPDLTFTYVQSTNKITNFFRSICRDITNTPSTNKIKIGFASNLLITSSSVADDRIGIIRCLIQDDRYQVYIYTRSENESSLYNIAINSIEFKNKIILSKSIIESRKIISNHNLDILVYPEIGMDAFYYYLAFARLAPIQINTWGHSETSGIDTIDYYFSSKYYEISQAQDNYSEKLVCLDSMCTYYYSLRLYDFYKKINDSTQNENLLYYNLPKSCNIYGIFQTVYKYDYNIIDIIKNILYQDPKAIILILTYDKLEKVFLNFLDENLGFHMNRVRIFKRFILEDFCKLIKCVDIILDSYPFGGCNTSLQAFSLGKVVITLPGDKINSRFTTGFYTKMGITEPICTSIKEYVDKSVYYANNKNELKILQEKIINNSYKIYEEFDSIITWKNKLEELYKQITPNILVEPPISNNIEIIIARFNEDLNWIQEYPFNVFKYIVYNKGNNENFNKTNVIKIINLPNIGRCDHTYLYHVIENYDKLANITVFFPGSLNINNKKIKARRILLNIIKSNFTKAYLVGYHCESIKELFKDFYLDNWQCTDKNNLLLNNELILHKSDIRPYGKWYTQYFGNMTVKWVTFLGCFSIDKKDIIQNPIEHYNKFLETVNKHSNPEAGHYIERSWCAIFYPLNYTVMENE
jgi:hypothetical protein